MKTSAFTAFFAKALKFMENKAKVTKKIIFSFFHGGFYAEDHI